LISFNNETPYNATTTTTLDRQTENSVKAWKKYPNLAIPCIKGLPLNKTKPNQIIPHLSMGEYTMRTTHTHRARVRASGRHYTCAWYVLYVVCGWAASIVFFVSVFAGRPEKLFLFVLLFSQRNWRRICMEAPDILFLTPSEFGCRCKWYATNWCLLLGIPRVANGKLFLNFTDASHQSFFPTKHCNVVRRVYLTLYLSIYNNTIPVLWCIINHFLLLFCSFFFYYTHMHIFIYLYTIFLL